MHERGCSWGIVGLLVAGAALAGCTSEIGDGTPTSSSTATTSEPTVETRAVSHVTQVQDDVKTAASTPTHCSPLECCFPDLDITWGTDAFEQDLAKLGCTPPQAYEIDEKAQDLWVWTRCPLRLELLPIIAKYSGSPYDARFVANACLGFQPGTIDVEYDPTCDTCSFGGFGGFGGGGGLLNSVLGTTTTASGGTVVSD